jgi:hypothetical protein
MFARWFIKVKNGQPFLGMDSGLQPEASSHLLTARS